jgi:hypothetical protein
MTQLTFQASGQREAYSLAVRNFRYRGIPRRSGQEFPYVLVAPSLPQLGRQPFKSFTELWNPGLSPRRGKRPSGITCGNIKWHHFRQRHDDWTADSAV